MDYANTTNVEFIVDPKVLFRGWLIYYYLQLFKLIKCKWLPEECADWFFDNIMTWSYCVHRRYSISRRKNSILINKHVLNREPVPLRKNRSCSDFTQLRFPPRGYSTKFNTEGGLRPEVQPLTLLYTIFERKGTPFVYLPLGRSLPV